MRLEFLAVSCAILLGCSGNVFFDTSDPDGKNVIKVSTMDYTYPITLKSFPNPELNLGDVFLWDTSDPEAVLEFAGEIGKTVEDTTAKVPGTSMNANISHVGIVTRVLNFGAGLDGDAVTTTRHSDSAGAILIDQYNTEYARLIAENGGKEPAELPFKLNTAKTDPGAFRYVVISGFQSAEKFPTEFKVNPDTGALASSDINVLDKDVFNIRLGEHIRYDCYNGSGSSPDCAFLVKIYEPSFESGSEGAFFGLEPTVSVNTSSIKLIFEKTFGK